MKLAIAGFHEGLAGQVSSWVSLSSPSLELVCFLHPHDEEPLVSSSAKSNRANSRFVFPNAGFYRQFPLIFGKDWSLQLKALGVSHILPSIPDSVDRAELVKTALLNNFQLLTAIHPSSVILPGSQIAPGCIIEPNVYIGFDVDIGIACHLHAGCQVDHNSVLGDFVTLNPRAVVAGNSLIGSRSCINLAACVSNSVKLGENTTVAAGAIVLRSYTQPGLRLFGIPAVPK